MSVFQVVFFALGLSFLLSVLVFIRAIVFQGRNAGHNQYMVKLLMPPPVSAVNSETKITPFSEEKTKQAA